MRLRPLAFVVSFCLLLCLPGHAELTCPSEVELLALTPASAEAVRSLQPPISTSKGPAFLQSDVVATLQHILVKTSRLKYTGSALEGVRKRALHLRDLAIVPQGEYLSTCKDAYRLFHPFAALDRMIVPHQPLALATRIELALLGVPVADFANPHSIETSLFHRIATIPDREARAGLLRTLYYATVEQEIPIGLDEPVRLDRTLRTRMFAYYAQLFIKASYAPLLVRDVNATEYSVRLHANRLMEMLNVPPPARYSASIDSTPDVGFPEKGKGVGECGGDCK